MTSRSTVHRWTFQQLCLRVVGTLAAVSIGSLAVAHRLAKIGDQRLWTEV